MLTKIKRQTCIHNYPNLPLADSNSEEDGYRFFAQACLAHYIFTPESATIKGQISLLASETQKLIRRMGFEELIFLGDTPVPWLYRNHEYEPVKDALKFLADNKVERRFNGGLQVDASTIPIFIKHLAWMVRSNAVLPYVYFTDKGKHIVGNICQYANLHISTITPEADKNLLAGIANSKFQPIKANDCGIRHSLVSHIKNNPILE